MELLKYWPTREYINQCIRTEAEELAEHTLLAVHEPMRLKRKGFSETVSCWDKDLLKDFLQIERPIPIIGRSGVGKSHLIRWLHAKLRIHPKATDWHIVRIPKNASLRQVLDLLLDGLEGEAFEQARQRVKTVGEQLNTLEVAELLLTFMGQQLRNEHQRAQETIEQYRQTNTLQTILKEEKEHLQKIMIHCNEQGLPSLINDPYFQTFLLDQKHCIFQFARRLTSGASDDELSENDYQVLANDLNFSYNLNDLSKPAAQYVMQARLNTNEHGRQQAAEMLNLVLGEATRTAFQQLFQFSGNNFQELFKQIRRDLHTKGKTLVVLVEDMAAISAIEDVLIDSLLEEGVYDGIETMCSLRSAIAVTDGYPGYLRRKDTLQTRAKAEWWIDEIQEGETELVMQQRIVDFCSRYINAARHGHQALEQCWVNREDGQWPPVWKNEEIDLQHLDAFGQASTGISLYPLSALSILALINKFCRDDQGELRFNPREVINQILLKVLRECRVDAENGQFPPVMLAGVYAPGVLRSELATLGLSAQSRCESLAAIWGYGAENLDELKEKLSADIALEFGLSDLASYLKGGVVHFSPTPKPKVKEVETQPLPDSSPQPDPEEAKLKALLAEIDLWCQREKNLSQNEAKNLRSALAEMYQSYARKEWAGIAELPPIKAKHFVNITLPYAMGNRGGSLVEFCSEADFTDQEKSILFHGAARAMLRYHHFNSKKNEGRGWDYPLGHDDYLQYQNFAARWVPGVLQTLRDNAREKLDASMAEHVACAKALAVFKESDNHWERLNKLLRSQLDLSCSFHAPVCETVSIERQEQLEKWEPLQEYWRKLLASNDHGLEGDLALAALKKVLKAPISNKIYQAVARALREVEQGVAMLVALFTDCESVDDFNRALESLEFLIKKLRTTGKYPTKDSVVTSRTFLSNIKKLSEAGHFDQIKKMERLITNSEVGQQWQMLNELDGDKVGSMLKVFENWNDVFNIAFPVLQTENSMWGGERIIEAKKIIDLLICSLQETIECVQDDYNGNS